MKTFILNTLSQIPSVNKQMDCMSIIKSYEWLVFNDQQSEEVEKFLFLKDDKLLVSVNGKSSYSQWQYMRVNSSLLLDDGDNKYMFKIIVCTKDLIFLKIDGTDTFSFLLNTKSNNLVNATYKDIKWYLKKNCNIDIFDDKEREEYERVQSDDIKKEKERKEQTWGKVLITLGIILGSFVLIGLILNICQDIIEKKEKKELYEKTHPLMSVTSLENRKSVNLGLSVDWATCNIGANSPLEEGNRYGWGDTSGIIYNARSSSMHYQDEPATDNAFEFAYPTRKDHIPPSTIVGTEYDIALQCWGKEWRMPTREEASELLDSCMFFVRNNYIVAIGPSGDSIQFPFDSSLGQSLCHGYVYATGDLDNFCKKYIHTFRIDNEHANNFALKDGHGNYVIKVAMENAERAAMLPVRAVRVNPGRTYNKHQ